MSKLLKRLSDPARSGVYRVKHERDIREALSGAAHDLVAVRLEPGKKAMLAAIAQALDFPRWFGGNWDALQDCLADLSWRNRVAHVILFSNAQTGQDLGILIDVLGSAAQSWNSRGQPLFAVFIDPAGQIALPDLYKEEIV
jgi:RNAse (barnase) inhibitor barstar